MMTMGDDDGAGGDSGTLLLLGHCLVVVGDGDGISSGSGAAWRGRP